MDRFALGMVLVVSVAGLFLLGRGLTGYAVSETCCTGPHCSAVSHCNPLQPELQEPASPYDLVTLGLGLLALTGCLLALLFIGREHRSH